MSDLETARQIAERVARNEAGSMSDGSILASAFLEQLAALDAAEQRVRALYECAERDSMQLKVLREGLDAAEKERDEALARVAGLEKALAYIGALDGAGGPHRPGQPTHHLVCSIASIARAGLAGRPPLGPPPAWGKPLSPPASPLPARDRHHEDDGA